MVRKSITLYDDQYNLAKVFNSPTLFFAFGQYMFEDIEPEWLTEQEQALFDSLRVRMDNLKKRADAWSKWWSNSHWWWRPRKQQQNNKKTTKKQEENKQKTNKKQAKNNQVIGYKYKVKDKDKVKGKGTNKINKHLYLDFVFLSEEEYNNLISKLWKKLTEELIEKLNNYIGSSWKKYKSHYYTILNWSKKETNWNPNYDIDRQLELHRKKIAEQIQSFSIDEKQDGPSWNDVGWYNRRNDIWFS